MSADAVKRKLAAILSADAVGYSRLMAQDEAATLKTLNAHRGLMGGLIRQHGGRVVDAVGDNLLAEFPSVVDAVACAVAVQGALAERNADLPTDGQMPFRIGIHLGDVMVEGDAIVGDGVNVAARLESLAEPAGISISGAVHEQVRRKLSHSYEDLGEQTLKNIADPVHVYRVQVAEGEKADDAGKLTVPGFAGRPAIAVLAFDNLSDDPEQDYFAAGIAEDLITRLSAFRLFPIIARNSSFTYKGKAVDVKQVSRELGVRYVVEGSVRRAGDRVRISVQLIDATTGHHIWAKHYDRELDEIFALQDEITETVVGSLEPTLEKVEWHRSMRQAPQNLDAWDWLIRGYWHQARYTKEDNAKARSHFEKAAAMDPQFPQVFGALAEGHFNDIAFGWTEAPAETIAEMDRTARRCIELDSDEPKGLLGLAATCLATGRQQELLEALDRCTELDLSLPLQCAEYAAIAAMAGRPDDAIATAAKGMRLSPRDPNTWLLQHGMGMAHFAAGRYADAADWARKATHAMPEFPYAHATLAASSALLGRTAEARAAIDEMRRLLPGVSPFDLRQLWSAADAGFMERHMEGWRKAGWKDDEQG